MDDTESTIPSEKVGIVLEGGSASSLKGVMSPRVKVGIGDFFLVGAKKESPDRMRLVQLSSYDARNDFYTDSPLLKSLMSNQTESVLNLLDENTVILADLDLMPGNDKEPVMPGEQIYNLPSAANNEEVLRLVYGYDLINNRSNYVSFGKLRNKDLSYFLNIQKITMHMGIFGETGAGKSYSMRCLISKLSNMPSRRNPNRKVALPMIVIDANGDYTDLLTTKGLPYVGFGYPEAPRKFLRHYVLSPINGYNSFYDENDEIVKSLIINLSCMFSFT